MRLNQECHSRGLFKPNSHYDVHILHVITHRSSCFPADGKCTLGERSSEQLVSCNHVVCKHDKGDLTMAFFTHTYHWSGTSCSSSSDTGTCSSSSTGACSNADSYIWTSPNTCSRTSSCTCADSSASFVTDSCTSPSASARTRACTTAGITACACSSAH